MTMKDHFSTLAAYNGWANARLYRAAAELDEDALWADKGAFFGSLMGTLNHILVTDRVWLARFRGETPPALALNAVLYRRLPELTTARGALDGAWSAFVDGLDEGRLDGLLAFRSFDGTPCETPLAATLAHVFNHQTHHRGQAHTLLSQSGRRPPELDLVYYLRRR